MTNLWSQKHWAHLYELFLRLNIYSNIICLNQFLKNPLWSKIKIFNKTLISYIENFISCHLFYFVL